MANDVKTVCVNIGEQPASTPEPDGDQEEFIRVRLRFCANTTVLKKVSIPGEIRRQAILDGIQESAARQK